MVDHLAIRLTRRTNLFKSLMGCWKAFSKASWGLEQKSRTLCVPQQKKEWEKLRTVLVFVNGTYSRHLYSRNPVSTLPMADIPTKGEQIHLPFPEKECIHLKAN